MIQRIQSVYLAIGGLLLGSMFLADVCRLRIGEVAHYLGLTTITNPEGVEAPASGNTVLLILVPLTTALMLFNIFLYKNRPLQLKLCRLSFLLIVGTIVALYFFIGAHIESLAGKVTVGYGYGSAVPIVALVLNFLALRGIHKDEKLVKSLDRLR